VPLAIEDPDAAGSGPAGIHRDAIARRRVRGIESVRDEQDLLPGAQVELPDVSLVEETEDVSRLELLALLAGAEKENPMAIRRPVGLKLVQIAVGELQVLPVCRFLRNTLRAMPLREMCRSCFPSGDQAGYSSTRPRT